MKKSKRSLRSILMLWFLLFSIVPLAFVTGYSLVIYERAIDDELKKRLDGNAREIAMMINDFDRYLSLGGKIHSADASLIFDLSGNSVNGIQKIIETWMKNYAANRISVFDEEGRLLIAMVNQGEGKSVRQTAPAGVGDVYLSDSILNELKTKNQFRVRDVRPGKNLEVVMYSNILNKRGHLAGHLEEIIEVNQKYLVDLRKRLKLEVILMNKEGQVAVASNDDFLLYPQKFFSNGVSKEKYGFVDLTVRDEPYGFMIKPLDPSRDDLIIGLGASKRDVKTVLRRITIALFTVSGIVILLLIPTLMGISKIILKPLDYLVSAAQKIESGESAQRIPIESSTEISVLTETFNRMSQRVTSARIELENNVKELEAANKELQATQAQLVHSSKMVSLGQLVAGIAHELNNPIGFIYSNMAHLRDYSERLTRLIQIAEMHPATLESEKKKLEFDYIVEDLPRLIKSCEDGARRTRDIVVGLRNFSRLDEAKLKEVDLEESISNTLDLLTGELKNRIEVVCEFGKIPKVNCFASQINQVLMNILTNAAQAIPEKGKIVIKTLQDKDFVKISIKDSGSGMDIATTEKIFDPFFTTKPVGQGTGLGLSISYGIVKKHGGDIRVDSRVGQGTEFTILLPIAGPSEA